MASDWLITQLPANRKQDIKIVVTNLDFSMKFSFIVRWISEV